jgi:hypothetical protein
MHRAGLRGRPAGQLPGAPNYKGLKKTGINWKYGVSELGFAHATPYITGEM